MRRMWALPLLCQRLVVAAQVGPDWWCSPQPLKSHRGGVALDVARLMVGDVVGQRGALAAAGQAVLAVASAAASVLVPLVLAAAMRTAKMMRAMLLTHLTRSVRGGG